MNLLIQFAKTNDLFMNKSDLVKLSDLVAKVKYEKFRRLGI